MTIHDEVQQIRSWRDAQLENISKIEFETYQRILYIACTDAFVQRQEHVRKKRHESPSKRGIFDREEFSVFLQKYVTSEYYSKWLSLVCPATLFYDYSRFLSHECLDLDAKNGAIYIPDDPKAVSESQRLIGLLPENKREDAIKKHSYAALIYQARNKLVHEMISPGGIASLYSEDSDPIPPHMFFDDLYVNKWVLHIPVKLVRICFEESTTHYLEECEKLNIHPLGDPIYYLNFRFSYYDCRE